MVTMVSKREKKRLAREGLKRLGSNPSWQANSLHDQSPQEQLRQLNQDIRTDSIYEPQKKSPCPECSKIRESSADETALCETHLKDVMGF